MPLFEKWPEERRKGYYAKRLHALGVTEGMVLREVWATWAREGRPPTMRELARGLGVSLGTAKNRVATMAIKGLLDAEEVGVRTNGRVWPPGLRAKVRTLAAKELQTLKD